MIASIFLLSLLSAPAPSTLTGYWQTADKDIVQVVPCESDHLCLRLAAIGLKDAPSTDEENPDPSLRSRKLCGLTIGTGFAPDGDAAAKDGKIYDPKSGKTYSAQMKVDGDTLKLHGYVGVALLGRTETWRRSTDANPSCR